MRLLRLAIEIQRWDLAAHTIVLAAATTLKNGDKPDAKSKSKEKKPASGGFPQLCPTTGIATLPTVARNDIAKRLAMTGKRGCQRQGKETMYH